jgi:hypothetical protein
MDQAMNWLEKGYDERFNPGVLLRPGFDPLRSDSRFQNLVHRVGHDPEKVSPGVDRFMHTNKILLWPTEIDFSFLACLFVYNAVDFPDVDRYDLAVWIRWLQRIFRSVNSVF